MELIDILKSGISILTPIEYMISSTAMTLSTVITEFIKRHVVWKKDGHKQGIIHLSLWGGSLPIPKVVIIGFLISALFTLTGFIFYGSNLGKLILVPLTVGVLTPLVYKLSIVLLRKYNFHELANFISGDRRENPRV